MNPHTRSYRLFAVLVAALIVVGCAPAAAPSAVPVSSETPVLYVTVIVTRAPTATPTLVPTATLPYDIAPLLGEWSLDMNFALRGNRVFNDVRFVGSATLEVALDGSVTGNIEFYPTVLQPPCVASVLDNEPLRAAIAGTLHKAPDGSVTSDLVLTPDTLLHPTGLRLFCPGFKVAYESREPLLWPALQATYGLTFTLPFRAGYESSLAADLTGPTGGGLRGLLFSEIRLSH